MYRIVNNKSSGKTRQLMEIAKRNNAVFVCGNPHAMETKARAYGIIGIEFMDYSTFLRSNGVENYKYVIDELETFVYHFQIYNKIRGEFTGYTLTSGD